MDEYSDLIPEFVEESLEYLKNIEEDIMIIEQGSADSDLIDRVFQAVHSIKGSASFLGLKSIERLSHRMEDIFNSVRNDELEFTSQISFRVLKSVDKLKEMLEENTKAGDNFDISRNLEELDECLSGKSGAVFSEPLFDSLRKQGKKIYQIQFELKEGENRNYSTPLEFFHEIEKTGEVVEQNVDMELVLKDDSFTGEGIPLSIIYATVLEKDLVAYIFGINENRVKELEDIDTLTPEEKRRETEKIKAPEVEVIEQEPEVEPQPLEVTAEIEVEEEDVDEIKDTNQYLTFMVGDEEYGIGITQVHEIITLQKITGLPGAEDFTRGIINFRGDIIPVYDFRLRLKFEPRAYDNETVILVVMIHEKRVGIIVDRVSEVIRLTRDQVTEAPQMQQIPSEYVIGIGQKEGKFVVLLKVSAIFNIRHAAREDRL